LTREPRRRDAPSPFWRWKVGCGPCFHRQNGSWGSVERLGGAGGAGIGGAGCRRRVARAGEDVVLGRVGLAVTVGVGRPVGAVVVPGGVVVAVRTTDDRRTAVTAVETDVAGARAGVAGGPVGNHVAGLGCRVAMGGRAAERGAHRT